MSNSSFCITFVAVLSSALIACANGIEQLASAIEHQAELYQSVEIVAKGKYELLDNKKLLDSRYPKMKTFEYRVIIQGDFAYFDSDSEMPKPDGTSHFETRRVRYDGSISRVLVNQIENVSNDKFDNRSAMRLRPHNILFILNDLDFPTAWFVRGGKAMKTPPADQFISSYIPGGEILTQYLGAEEKDGYQCEKIKVFCVPKDKPTLDTLGYFNIWFAKDRNFIPIRFEVYDPSTGMVVPNRLGIVKEFLELAPSVYFPKNVQIDTYNVDKITNAKTPHSKSVFQITKATLDPNYDRALFQQFEYPNLTRVYHLENGKIVKEYTVNPDVSIGNSSWTWLVYAGAGLLLLVIVAVIIRSRRKSQQN